MKEILTYENGTARCTLVDRRKNREYTGIAICHEQDYDMESEKTGYHIASMRAYIQYIKACIKDSKSELQGLNGLFYSMKHSGKFNPKSYEAKMLYRQRKIKEKEIASLSDELYQAKHALKDYIDTKDEIYKTIRANRLKESEVEIK